MSRTEAKETKTKKKMKPAKKVLLIIGIVLGSIVLLVLAYCAYVLISFHRIEDNQPLSVTGSAKEEAVPVGTELTAVSYNIGFGAYSDDYTFFMDGGKESWAFSKEAVYENLDGALNAIQKKNPDIALIQEVDFDSTRSYHVDERELIAERMLEADGYSYTFAQNYDSPFLMYPITQPHGINHAGLLTFSRCAITEGLRKSLPIEEGISKVIDLDRCYSKNRVKTDNGKELVIYNHHLSAFTAKAETAETQLSMLVQDMQAEYDAGNYCIAGGDFNRDLLGNSPEIFHTPTLENNWAQPVNMSLFTKDITLVAPFDESDPAASCRNPDKPYEEGDFVVTVDGFVKSANVEAIEADVIDTGFAWSDHNPVILRFRLSK